MGEGKQTIGVALDSKDGVVVQFADGWTLRTHSVEAILLYTILQRLPDPSATLAEAVEWESLDGLMRTTDKAKAENWAAAVGVRVVRRATGVPHGS
jgi:hypothetical protein